MPATGAKMLKMLEDPDTTVDEIEDILRRDPGLTGNVLRLANSAFFGIPSKIASVRQAVLVLGLKKLTQLVVTACVNAVMDKPVSGYDLPPGDLWRHSIAVSIAAEALVKDKKNLVTADIFTPALLHDIGKIILGPFVKEAQDAIRQNVESGMPSIAAENVALGTDHAKIGAQILAQWSFPREVVNAVRWHHDPDGTQDTGVTIDIIYLSNLLCQTNADDSQNPRQGGELSPAVIERLGLDLNQFEGVQANVAQWVDELSQALTFN